MWNYKKRISAVLTTATILTILIISAFVTNETVDTIVLKKEESSRSCVVIDAGHGGIDGGAVSYTGAEESHINLKIALRLNDLLHLLGINTVMIRTEDVSIYTTGHTIAAKKVSDLRERVRITNETPNAILISIHQNYFEDSAYAGAQMFYYTDSVLAVHMQDAFKKTINQGSRRNAKKADGVYLMQNVQCPGVLIECGFLSNPSEEQLLQDPEYQKKMCCVISSVVSCYIYNNTVA